MGLELEQQNTERSVESHFVLAIEISPVGAATAFYCAQGEY